MDTEIFFFFYNFKIYSLNIRKSAKKKNVQKVTEKKSDSDCVRKSGAELKNVKKKERINIYMLQKHNI